MSRVMIDKRGVERRVEVVCQGEMLTTSKKSEDFIALDFPSQTARIKLIVSTYYHTAFVLVDEGDCVQVYRRYPMWLFCVALLFLICLCVIKPYQIIHTVILISGLLLLDKYYAYAIRKTTSHLVMS